MMRELIKLFLILFFFGQAFATNDGLTSKFESLGQKIQEDVSIAKQYPYSDYHLNWAKEDLATQLKSLDRCLSKEKLALDDLKANASLLNVNSPMPFLQAQKIALEQQITLHQDNLQFCEFLSKKARQTNVRINVMMYLNHKREILKPKPNIFQTFKAYYPLLFSNLNMVDFKAYSLHQSFPLKSLRIMWLLTILILLYRVFAYFNVIAKTSFSLPQLFLVIGMFFLSNPFFFNALSYDYINNFVFVLVTMQFFNIVSIIVFCFYLKNICKKYSYRDYLSTFIGVIPAIGLLFISYQFYFLKLQAPSIEISGLILIWKYLFLLVLVFYTIAGVYFLNHYVLPIIPNYNCFIRLFKYLLQTKSICLAFFFLFILVLGCLGLVDLAIAIWFFVIDALFTLVWFFIFLHVLNLVIDSSANPNSWMGKKVNQFLFIGQTHVLFELKFLKLMWLFAYLFVFYITLWPTAYLPESMFLQVSGFFFESKKTMALDSDVVLINLVTALGAFMVLNIFNRIISVYLAKRLSQNVENMEKYQSIFYLIGLFVILFLCINLTRIDLKNFAFVLGGLSFGLGIGLRDLVGNFIAGLILMFASQLSKGQYVIIAEARGFIQKISLMETQIESFNKVILTVPNLKVLGSVVQNFSTSKKMPPRFHFTFVFSDINELEHYKKMILDILVKEEDVLMAGYFKPEFFVLPGNNPHAPQELELNLDFSIQHIKHLWQVISNLTLHFTQSFNKSNCAIHVRSSSLVNL